eukprot:gnl/MRDRNA2_/MRDRNA2_106509_c0_seq1.p1 gnl/MRDRNA2_/MRDRNA2_106509_c0~~gnl/MRDRNA2_/MRDRNA2_106509_c0_seq1.p1  ORF type:complete len:263 (-),score=64.84 gnl/MRDRNA2_/MRDRNA2_106509_c0_seq1:188-895(-)
MAPTQAPVQAPSKFKKYAVTFSALAIFGAFTGSALAMKIAPLKGLLPADMNKDILAAWSKFAALPQIDMVLKPLKMDAAKFMLAVATLHLLIAMILVCPTGKFGTKLAGLWAMVAMLGAEFCTRQTAYVPAGFPKEFKTLGAAVGSATHLFLFLCGACLVFSPYQGTLLQMLSDLLASIKKPAKTEEQRGRSAQSEDKGNKRDSTPNPKSGKKAGGSPPPSPTKSPRGRPSSKGR